MGTQTTENIYDPSRRRSRPRRWKSESFANTFSSRGKSCSRAGLLPIGERLVLRGRGGGLRETEGSIERGETMAFRDGEGRGAQEKSEKTNICRNSLRFMEAASYQPATPGNFFQPSQVSALFRVLAPVSVPRQSIFRPMENFHLGLRSRCRYDSSERPRSFTGL